MRNLLLCPPDHYGIEYEINPWMSRARGADVEATKAQWHGLHQRLSSLDCKIDLVPPQPKLPDMVFTANAGLTVGKKFIPEQFSPSGTRGRSSIFCALDGGAWLRSCVAARRIYTSKEKVMRFLPATPCSAVTNFAPISRRIVPSPTCLDVSSFQSSWSTRAFIISIPVFVRCRMEVLFGFQRRSTNMVSAPFAITSANLIEVAEEEAAHFSCNAVVLDRDIVLPEGAPKLVATLQTAATNVTRCR